VEKEAKTDAELEMILQRLIINGVFVSVGLMHRSAGVRLRIGHREHSDEAV
jgi:hypothetical protein